MYSSTSNQQSGPLAEMRGGGYGQWDIEFEKYQDTLVGIVGKVATRKGTYLLMCIS